MSHTNSLNIVLVMAVVTKQFRENCYASDLPVVFVMSRYLFNGIRFHFHLASQEFPPSAYTEYGYSTIANSSSYSHVTDRRTDKPRLSFHNDLFI